MTLNQFLAHLGWSLTDLCKHAGIEAHTARRAVRENITSARTARKIADAFSKAMGQDIKPGDIQGLLIQN